MTGNLIGPVRSEFASLCGKTSELVCPRGPNPYRLEILALGCHGVGRNGVARRAHRRALTRRAPPRKKKGAKAETIVPIDHLLSALTSEISFCCAREPRLCSPEKECAPPYRAVKLIGFGPYTGMQFTNEITNTPVSFLAIPSSGQLEVYEPANEIAPVIVMRSKDGVLQWSRLLLPEQRFEDGQVKQAAVRDLRLKRLERDRDCYEVLFSCDWDWGGKEAGLLDLDNEYRFKSFRISW